MAVTKIKAYKQEEITLARSRGFRRKRPFKTIMRKDGTTRPRRTEGEILSYIKSMNNYIDAARAVNKKFEEKKKSRERAKKLRESLQNSIR